MKTEMQSQQGQSNMISHKVKLSLEYGIRAARHFLENVEPIIGVR
jgi:hypothetical protein